MNRESERGLIEWLLQRYGGEAGALVSDIVEVASGVGASALRRAPGDGMKPLHQPDMILRVLAKGTWYPVAEIKDLVAKQHPGVDEASIGASVNRLVKRGKLEVDRRGGRRGWRYRLN